MTADLKVNKLETVGVWCPSLSDVQFQFQQMALITSSMCSIDIDNGNLLERPIGGPGQLIPLGSRFATAGPPPNHAHVYRWIRQCVSGDGAILENRICFRWR